MKKVHISYGNEQYYKSLDVLKQTSLEVGKVDEVICYKESDLKLTEFWRKNSFILNQPRGAGYWIWKPYIILQTLEQLNEGDVVLYTDGGMSVIDNLNPLFNITLESSKYGRMLFQIPGGHINKTFTKRDCFILMGCDEKKYYDGNLTNGAISLWKKTPENIEYLKEYLRYLRDPRIVTDAPNMMGPNLIEFKDHRHDQSVLSLMSIKYNLELYRDPTQWGEEDRPKFPNSPYPQLFNHHRNKF